MAKDLTLKQIADRAGVSVSTAKAWQRQGYFPNARLEETPMGSVWLVPLSDVNAFQRPAMGRPATNKPAKRRSAKRKRKEG
jgi:hypothetical protein